MKRAAKPLFGALALLALVAAAAILPVKQYLIAFVEATKGLGTAGAIAYAAVYVVAAVAMLPASILTIGAGYVYGPLAGVAIVSPASVLAATIAFALGRSMARPWIEGRVAGNPRFAAIDRAVGREGFRIVFLLRLSPVFPYNLLNYALGLTGVRLLHYVVASFIGMLPGTFLYVYLGSALGSLTELLAGKGPPRTAAGTVLFVGGLVATAIVTALVTRTARRALREAVPDNPAAEAQP